ncbi:MAG: HNH endonuclease [Dehalococcoidia bacterium]|nr:HNH endonuclease [Dehalococcoidia bacterium]
MVGLLEMDHILPVSRGGSSDLANGQVLCKTCHTAKGWAAPVLKKQVGREGARPG